MMCSINTDSNMQTFIPVSTNSFVRKTLPVTHATRTDRLGFYFDTVFSAFMTLWNTQV